MTRETVTHYELSLHPHNPALVHIINKDTGKTVYYKIRYHVDGNYAINLVDADSFAVYAETHSKSATDRTRSIILCRPNIEKENTEVIFRDTSILGFEWCFDWQGKKYRWTRENRMSNALECRCVRSSANQHDDDNVRVAQYFPRGIKNEYFGLLSVLRCDVQDRQGLELVLCMSILNMLDKADEVGWIGGLMNKKRFVNKRKLERENSHTTRFQSDGNPPLSKPRCHIDSGRPTKANSSSMIHHHPITTTTTTTTTQQQAEQEEARARFAEMVRHLDATATLHLSMPPSSRSNRQQNHSYLERLFLQEYQQQSAPTPPVLPNYPQYPSAPRRVSADEFHYPFMNQGQAYYYYT